MTNACVYYDFTIPQSSVGRVSLQDILNDNCSQWVFQLEKGAENGYIHYQGRMKLKVKKRAVTAKNAMGLLTMHLTPTCNRNTDNDFYVTKEESRLEGPWKSIDSSQFSIPKDVAAIKELYPWQKKLFDLSKIYEPRKVNIIIDAKGCTGKSTFRRYMGYYKHAVNIPPLVSAKDLMRTVMDRPKLGCYIIDLPRSMNKEKLAELYSAIEQVKTGDAYDDRYRYRDAMFDPPVVYVFTNIKPDPKFLSKDRWVYWIIDDDKELISSENNDEEFESSFEDDF